MQFQLKDVLEAVGPTASLVFAAWIFLSYLQSRYTGAAERYRELVENYRTQHEDTRAASLTRQIKLYRKRCDLMRIATNIGVASAILLIATLILAAIEVIAPPHPALAWTGSITAILGLLLVIVAASFVFVENGLMQQATRDETADIPNIE